MSSADTPPAELQAQITVIHILTPSLPSAPLAPMHAKIFEDHILPPLKAHFAEEPSVSHVSLDALGPWSDNYRVNDNIHDNIRRALRNCVQIASERSAGVSEGQVSLTVAVVWLSSPANVVGPHVNVSEWPIMIEPGARIPTFEELCMAATSVDLQINVVATRKEALLALANEQRPWKEIKLNAITGPYSEVEIERFLQVVIPGPTPSSADLVDHLADLSALLPHATSYNPSDESNPAVDPLEVAQRILEELGFNIGPAMMPAPPAPQRVSYYRDRTSQKRRSPEEPEKDEGAGNGAAATEEERPKKRARRSKGPLARTSSQNNSF